MPSGNEQIVWDGEVATRLGEILCVGGFRGSLALADHVHERAIDPPPEHHEEDISLYLREQVEQDQTCRADQAEALEKTTEQKQTTTQNEK